MGSLYAKLKGPQNVHRVVFLDEAMPDYDFFPEPDVSGSNEYAPLQLDADVGTWYYVHLDIDQVEAMIEPYSDNSSQAVESIDQAEYSVIDCLYLITDQKILFNRVSGAMRIHENGKQHIVFSADGRSIARTSFAIDFSGQADAVYDKAEKKLFFQNFAKVKPLFKGFDIFHQDITLEEKEAFLDNPFFEVGEFNLNYISLNDTRKIAAIRESLEFDLEDEETQSRIRSYANRYPSSGVSISDAGRIMIGNRKELSSTLKLLEQRYYTSEITGQRYMAGSSKKMSK